VKQKNFADVPATKNKFVFINCIHFYDVMSLIMAAFNKTMDSFICQNFLHNKYCIITPNLYFVE